MTDRPSFLAELRRRNVYRAAVFYAASTWLLVQVATQVFPFFGIPDWVVRWIVVAALTGVPFVLLFAWFYEWTPEGLKLEREVDPAESITRLTGRKLDFWIIGVLAGVVVLLMTDRFVVHRDADSLDSIAVPAKSIAVLPLANESGAHDQYFADGLSEDLITALSQLEGLKVIGRNSAFKFRDSRHDSRTIGAKLGVATLLEGSVRRAGDTVRISAQLVNAADGSMLWSQRYDRAYRDLFALQDEIAQAVATALKARLLDSAAAAKQGTHPPSGSLRAYNAYLQGRFYVARRTEADLDKAIAEYNEATRIDPDYAAAWAALSSAWVVRAGFFLVGADAAKAYAEAGRAADRALAAAPDLAAAHAARAGVYQNLLEWHKAEPASRRAFQLDPDGQAMGWAHTLSNQGRPAEAVALMEKQIETDPLNSRKHMRLAVNLAMVGRLEEAERMARKAIELQPTAVGNRATLTEILIQRGDPKAALAVAQQEEAGPYRDTAMALALQAAGERTAADAALRTAIDRHADFAGYQIAMVYALRQEPDKVFEWLERAWSNRDPGLVSMMAEPFLMRYRNDPRFAALCRKIGLPTPAEVASVASAQRM